MTLDSTLHSLGGGGSGSSGPAGPPGAAAPFNRVVNSGFDQDTVGAAPTWWGLQGASAPETFQVQNGWADRGANSLRLIQAVLAPGALTGIQSPTLVSAGGIAVTSGQPLSVRAVLRANVTMPDLVMHFVYFWYDGAGGFVGPTPGATDSPLVAGSVRVLQDTGIVPPPAAACLSVLIFVSNPSAGNRAVDMSIDSVAVSDGATIVYATPGPAGAAGPTGASGIVLPTATTIVVPQVIPMVAAWPLQDAAGSATGANATGGAVMTKTGGVTFGDPGPNGTDKAMTFDGTGQAIGVTGMAVAPSAYDSCGIAVGLWVKFTRSSTEETVMHVGRQGAPTGVLIDRSAAAGNPIQLYMAQVGANYVLANCSEGWHHFSLIMATGFTFAGGYLRNYAILYLDGVRIGYSNAGWGVAPASVDVMVGAAFTNTDPLIGAVSRVRVAFCPPGAEDFVAGALYGARAT